MMDLFRSDSIAAARSKREQLNLSDASMEPLSGDQETSSINLPNQREPVHQFAMDIGGSLIKVVYFDKSGGPMGYDHRDLLSGRKGSLELDNRAVGGRLHFTKFESSKIEECIKFLQEKGLHLGTYGEKKAVLVTGGGAYKYAKTLEDRLGVTIAVKDEMDCLIMGLNFFLQNVPFESYTFDPNPDVPHPRSFVPIWDNVYPYLLVQIGSGVSVLKVDNEYTFTRVDGSSLGGGTFWGLCSLLSGYTEFDAMLELASQGDNRQVDLVVGDIYGGAYGKIGLNPDVLASSFGKIMYNLNGETDESSIRPEDMAMSLLKMISNNIAQIAYLNAMRFNVKHIYFGGFFIRDHPMTMAKISYGVNYWSKGTMKALFLLHEGYLGAVGAFLKNEKCDKIFSPFRRTRERAQQLESALIEETFSPGRVRSTHLSAHPVQPQEAALTDGDATTTTTTATTTTTTPASKQSTPHPDTTTGATQSGAIEEPRDEEEEEGIGMDSSDWVQRLDQDIKANFNFPNFLGNGPRPHHRLALRSTQSSAAILEQWGDPQQAKEEEEDDQKTTEIQQRRAWARGLI